MIENSVINFYRYWSWSLKLRLLSRSNSEKLNQPAPKAGFGFHQSA